MVLTFHRYFSLSLLSDSSPSSLVRARGEWGFVHRFHVILDIIVLFFSISHTANSPLPSCCFFSAYSLSLLYLLLSRSVLSGQNRRVRNIHLDRLYFSKRMRSRNLIAELPSPAGFSCSEKEGNSLIYKKSPLMTEMYL